MLLDFIIICVITMGLIMSTPGWGLLLFLYIIWSLFFRKRKKDELF